MSRLCLLGILSLLFTSPFCLAEPHLGTGLNWQSKMPGLNGFAGLEFRKDFSDTSPLGPLGPLTLGVDGRIGIGGDISELAAIGFHGLFEFSFLRIGPSIELGSLGGGSHKGDNYFYFETGANLGVQSERFFLHYNPGWIKPIGSGHPEAVFNWLKVTLGVWF